MRWLIIFVTAFVLMFGGGIAGMAEDSVPGSILDGIMTELQEARTYRGDVTNHTFYKAKYVIFPLLDHVDHKVSDPVVMGELAPGETKDIELEAGDYMFVAVVTLDGKFRGSYRYEFKIVEGGTDDYGFDIRSGKPPVKL